MKQRENTLIFLDEIQAYPHLLTLLKFLAQDGKCWSLPERTFSNCISATWEFSPGFFTAPISAPFLMM